MSGKQQRGFAELIKELRELCSEQRTGVVFIRPGDGSIVNIGLSEGRIVSLSFRRKLGQEALPLLAEITSGQLDFVKDLPTSTKTPLPPTETILEKLSQWSRASPSLAAGSKNTSAVQLDESVQAVLQETLAEYIGPMAHVVCDKALLEGKDLKTAIGALAEKIPDRAKAQRFIDALHSTFQIA